MNERTALITRVGMVSRRFNIEKALVDRVVKAYLEFCKLELINGHRVNFLNMAMVVPDYEVYDYKTTFAYKCMQISKEQSIPSNTVTHIIQGYLDTVREDIYMGKSANIYGIMTLSPLFEEGVVTRVYSTISQSLQNYLDEYGNHARVYTNKIFKRRVKEAYICRDR